MKLCITDDLRAKSRPDCIRSRDKDYEEIADFSETMILDGVLNKLYQLFF